MMMRIQDEIAAAAARWVVEEGLEYGPAKSRAARELGAGRRSAWPDNDLVEQAVREYIAVFCAESQAQELAALRALACQWMERLQDFRPHLAGAVWRGTATRLNDIYLQLFCDDPKSAELALIDQGVRFQFAAFIEKRGVVFVGFDDKQGAALTLGQTPQAGGDAKVERHAADQKTGCQASLL